MSKTRARARARVASAGLRATAAYAEVDGRRLRFWQAFLAADLEFEKARGFLENLGSLLDPLSAFLSWRGLNPAERDRVMARFDEGRLAKAESAGVQVLERDGYPANLLAVERQPHALMVWGDVSALARPMVAVVGTRSATTYGKAVAQKFAEAFARAGVTVVSGGALGIDGSAHAGALDGGGPTVCVMGTGVDTFYPSRHSELFHRVRGSGLLVSQFALGTPSYKGNFLLRNQLVAALSDAVLVVEAPERSGALSTATGAAHLSRDVFVVPGSISLNSFRGSHALIREGATLVDHPDQVLEQLGISGVGSGRGEVRERDGDVGLVLEALGDRPEAAEVIAARAGVGVGAALEALTELELEGLVQRDSSGYALRP